MEFNPSKCEVVHITRSKNSKPTRYVLHGQTLHTTENARYLGVDISSNLSWNNHIDRIAAKANRSLGFVKRNIKVKSPNIRECAFKTLVRPQLEYASTIFDPYTQTNINKLERVQRRAARWTSDDYSHYSSVSDMLQRLDWRTLQQRRADAHLCLLYKIIHEQVAISIPHYFEPNHRVSRFCHSMSFKQNHTRVDYYKFSFFPRTIVQWNALPSDIVLLQDFEAFKLAVSQLQHTKP